MSERSVIVLRRKTINHLMKFRVKTAFIAVHRRSDGASEFIQLEPGTVFTVRGAVHSGMVNIIHNRRILAVFLADVKQRAERISTMVR